MDINYRFLRISIFIVLISRTILAFLAQGIFALATHLSVDPMSILEAGTWWTVYGSIIDIGYFLLLRLKRILTNSYLPIFIVMFFWAFKHVALPVTLNFEYSLYRFLTVLPLVILPIIYLKTKRLVPFIIVHYNK